MRKHSTIGLKSQNNDDVKCLPLNREPSDLWESRAVIALNAGLSPESLAETVGMWGYEWTGSESSRLQASIDLYEKLSKHPDCRFHVVAARGLHWARKCLKAARHREFAESI